MTSFLAVLSLLIQGALLYLVYGIFEELKRLRELQQNPPPVMKLRGDHSRIKLGMETNLVGGQPTTYAVWAWRGTCWELELGSVPPGFEPVGPPKFQGTFCGQRIKKECVRC